MEELRPSDPVMVGGYRLAGRLGSGGMGQVYLGVSAAADRVAVKVIRPELVSAEELRQRFALEVDNLRMVYGARVARFEGADLDGNPPWLAVEYVPGRTLHRHIDAAGPLSVELGAFLGAMLADGLGKIHQAGLLHRDLKPQNILLGPDGPKVIDFGLAALRDRETRLTETGMVVGTVAYMPPEQARGDTELTTAADVYALGATLVYALTGHNLYTAAHVHALLMRITDPQIHPDVSDVPTELLAVITAMTAYDPTARPSLDEVNAHLLQIATAHGESAELLRARLVEATYVEPPSPPTPPGGDDPLIDETDLSTAATEEPPAGHPSNPSLVPAGSSAARSGAPIDVGWLVDRTRRQYARDAAF